MQRWSSAIAAVVVGLGAAGPVGGANPAAPCDVSSDCIEIFGPILDSVVLDPGVYLVTANIVIAEGVTLTLPKGTTLYFQPNTGGSIGTGISGRGTLRVEGTADEEVLMKSNSPTPQPGDWLGVRLSGAGNLITHARIEFADTAIDIRNGDGEISHSTITMANTAIAITNASATIFANEIDVFRLDRSSTGIALTDLPMTPATRVSRNILTGNGSPRPRFGISLAQFDVGPETSAQLVGNEIRNFDLGIDLTGSSALVASNLMESTGSGVSVRDASPLIVDNVITSGSGFAILSDDGSPLIQGNTIMRNENGLGLYGGSPHVVDNTITDNLGVGIYLGEGAVFPQPDPRPVVNDNRVFGNGTGRTNPVDLLIRVPVEFGSVDATENFWGSLNPTVIEQRIDDGKDRLNFSYAAANICPLHNELGEPVAC